MNFESTFSQLKEEFFNDLKTLISYPSIGTDPEYRRETLACANWLMRHLEHIGFKSELLQVPNVPPCVYGHLHISDDLPTVLLYGHYDVQPIGDKNAWSFEPFSGKVDDGRIHGRGARDNKGQFFFNIKGMEAAYRTGNLKYNLKVFLDGEEESASISTLQQIPGWKEKLQADLLMASETQGATDGRPAIIMGYRGIGILNLRLKGANRALHSGHYGGMVHNPAIALGRAISSIFNPDGTIAIRGFFDDLKLPDEKERQLLNKSGILEADVCKRLDVAGLAGDPDYSPMERVAFFPCIEVPGFNAGISGELVRTAIPPVAEATIHIRSARGQDERRLLNLLIEHLKLNIPKGIEMEVTRADAPAPAMAIDLNSKTIQRADALIKEVLEVEPDYLWTGCSIPVIASIAKLINAEPLMVGFGMPEDREHASDESFSVEQFRKGFLYVANFLSQTGALG